MAHPTFKQLLLAVLLVTGLASCSKAVLPEKESPPDETTPPITLADIRQKMVDADATDETAALFHNMRVLAETHILFGHQDATKRGLNPDGTEWANEEHRPSVPRDKSDVNDVVGAYPAVYGHDFNHISGFFEPGHGWFAHEKEIAQLHTIDAYNRGGINTYSWHYANPVSQGSFYWSESPVIAVRRILPGGDHHETYKASLRTIADYAKSLVGNDGKLVPVIFRPFHEFDGDWFWWGQAHCTADEYIRLYRFTVTYLRDVLEVRNFLYAWSPDRFFQNETEFLRRYPGDAYVDLVGMDNYGDLETASGIELAANKLQIVSDYAVAKSKIAALTETGLLNLTQRDWYTQVLLKALQQNPVQLSYVLVWANREGGFWTPYKGHAAEADFVQFKNDPYVLFADGLPDMYKLAQ